VCVCVYIQEVAKGLRQLPKGVRQYRSMLVSLVYIVIIIFIVIHKLVYMQTSTVYTDVHCRSTLDAGTVHFLHKIFKVFDIFTT
jgi:hypothetical protein